MGVPRVRIVEPVEIPAWSPCDNCAYYDSCADLELACTRYARYLEEDIGGERDPSRAIYDAIFNDGDFVEGMHGPRYLAKLAQTRINKRKYYYEKGQKKKNG